MRKFGILIVLFSTLLSAQNKDTTKKGKYLEDQIYIGLTFINLTDLPSGARQNGFSSNFSLGFIKDIPLNTKGTFALGIGLGYGQNTYFQNIKISELNNQTNFEVLDGTIDFNKNKIKTFAIELPLELRWRSSTPTKYKFWRFYAGTKFSYAFSTKSKFKNDGSTTKVIGIPEFNKLQYGLTLAAGYGTWNFNFYYGLSDLFSNAEINPTTPLTLRDFRLGLIFYIY